MDKYYFICHDKPRRTKQKIRYSLKTQCCTMADKCFGSTRSQVRILSPRFSNSSKSQLIIIFLQKSVPSYFPQIDNICPYSTLTTLFRNFNKSLAFMAILRKIIPICPATVCNPTLPKCYCRRIPISFSPLLCAPIGGTPTRITS